MGLSGLAVTFLGAFAKWRKATIGVITSACLTARNSAANAKIFMKFDI
jgi:hypothetical protein